MRAVLRVRCAGAVIAVACLSFLRIAAPAQAQDTGCPLRLSQDGRLLLDLPADEGGIAVIDAARPVLVQVNDLPESGRLRVSAVLPFGARPLDVGLQFSSVRSKEYALEAVPAEYVPDWLRGRIPVEVALLSRDTGEPLCQSRMDLQLKSEPLDTPYALGAAIAALAGVAGLAAVAVAANLPSKALARCRIKLHFKKRPGRRCPGVDWGKTVWVSLLATFVGAVIAIALHLNGVVQITAENFLGMVVGGLVAGPVINADWVSLRKALGDG